MVVLVAVLRVASATENGASVYPVGVETVLPGMAPVPNTAMLYEFSTFHTPESFVGARGHSSVPGFRLNVLAGPMKIAQGNVHVLGGTLNSNLALPVVHECEWQGRLGARRRSET